MTPVVVRHVARADADVIRRLGDLGVATVHEAQSRSGLMRPYVRPIYPAARVAGAALTVSCHPGDNLMVHAALDVSDLTSMAFPVWSKAISAQGTAKNAPGSVNIDVVCAGAMVRPGDVIIGDRDGVVVVPREAAADIAQLGEERIAREARTRERLRSGELGLDIYGLRARLAELGVDYVD